MKTIVLAASSLLAIALGEVALRTGEPKPTVSVQPYNCVDAAEFLVSKFQKHAVIAMDEGPHGTVQTHEFLRSLFANRKFITTVNYVILEFINRDYQQIVDRFISGAKVDPAELREAWRQGTQAHSENFERPVYMKLLEAIRNANLQLTEEQKIRVLAGDPAIAWNNVTSLAQYYSAISQRDIFPGQLAMAYGIKDQKKVLIIYGGEHIKKKSLDPKDSTYYTITQFLTRNYPKSVFAVGAYRGNELPAGNKECAMNTIIEPTTGSDVEYDAYYFAGLKQDWKTDTLVNKIESPYWEELNRRSKVVWGTELDAKLKKPGEAVNVKADTRQ